MISFLSLLAMTTSMAQAIELVNPSMFSADEVKVIQKLNEEFAPQLKNFAPVVLRVEKVKSSDTAKSDYVNFDGRKQNATIRVSRANTDIYEFASTICHEMGHVFGGSGPVARDTAKPESEDYPVALRQGIETYTNIEGQCDYFAATKCIPRLMDVLPKVAKHPLCEGVADVERCSLVMTVGKITIDGMIARVKSDEKVNYGDRSRVMLPKTTYSGYQDYACRLQTWHAGALCEVDARIDFSGKDEDQGACVTGPGARPRCWFSRGSQASIYAY